MKRKMLFMVAALAVVMAACSTDSKAPGPKKPVITEHPVGREYGQGETAVPLTVAATTKDKKAKLSYQWYSKASAGAKSGTKIAGADSENYTPPTDVIGDFYYYVEVVSTLNKEKAKTTSDVAEIKVKDQSEIPQIGTSNGKEGEVEAGEDILLNVKLPDSIEELLESNEDYEVLYQWYDNGPRNSNVGGTAIPNATESSYLPDKTEPGTTYYYAVVTIKDKVSGEVVKTLTTSPQKVTVIVNTTIIDPTKENARVPLIEEEPDVSSKGYFVGVTADPLTVKARVSDGGILTYQWYSNTEDSATGGERISGARGTSYIPPTDEEGITWYYVVITNTIEDNQDGGQKTASRTSETVKVQVKKGQDAQAPNITVQPVSALYRLLDDATLLSVTATVTDGGKLTYQWFRKIENTNENGEPVTEITIEKTFKPPTNVKSLFYYYVEVTNTIEDNGDGGTKTATAKSNTAYIGTEVTPLTIGGLTAQNKTYDGTVEATVTGTVTGINVGTDKVTLVKGIAEFAQADVGNDIPVTLVGWYLDGDDKGNYFLYMQSGLKANITKATGAAVETPVVSAISPPTSFKITAGEVTLVDTATAQQKAQQTVEYAISTSASTAVGSLTWKDDPVFGSTNGGTGALTPSTNYYVHARSKASGNFNAGDRKVSAIIATVGGSAIESRPASTDVTENSITVGPVTLTEPEKGQSAEYARALNGTSTANQLTWQDSPVFNGLSASVTYYIYARSKANENYAAGTIVTDKNISIPITTSQPKVTFNTNGGSSLAPVTVIKGNKLGVPSAISKLNNTFDYWYTNEALTIPYDFDATVQDNMTLYAKWVLDVEIASMRNSKEMVWVKGGWYTMGTTGDTSTEKPHRVTLSGFWMGKYEVTQEKWEEIMSANPSSFKTAVQNEEGTPGKLPVEAVNWYDALIFCNKLSIQEGLSPAYEIQNANGTGVWTVYPVEWGTVPTSSDTRWNAARIAANSNGYRLPTEAQWEFACRAGTTTVYCTGDSISDATGWYNGNSASKTHKVGLKPTGVNAYGGNQWELYDMHGNVYEWCWDWYESDYGTANKVNPSGPASGTARVYRGGTLGDAGSLRSASRAANNPYRRLTVGLRVVRP